ncbi:CDP-diacylglycerol--glycerol-3-phosphate 3-phosphatidyltransferase [Cichlidogyrus casuarinus]|uniref:CDP-diacylglycerol--glycerol-3-phosphate 3-phosphatidyltransferase n=1 Tax=Cichlidogyrus casuarinus TaxID=1844966 RepID=A0ABD2PRP3_9PLAT
MAKNTEAFQGTNQNAGVKNLFSSSLEALRTLPKTVSVSAFMSPKLAGWNRLLPERWNEILNLQHIKAYVVDDTVIMSGANLSHDYFTNRQDRAWVIRNCAKLADFYQQLISVISKLCYQVDSSGSLIARDNDSRLAHQTINQFFTEQSREHRQFEGKDAVLVPVLQMGLFNVHYESELLQKLFDHFNRVSNDAFSIDLCSGYFNPSPQFESMILQVGIAERCKAMTVVVAAPEANGFLGSKGFSGFLPSLYRESLLRFSQSSASLGPKVQLLEYQQPAWTFHAKGLWIRSPQLTVASIGSSNFNVRSEQRDLESQLYLFTSNRQLQHRVATELELIKSPTFCKQIDTTMLRESEHRASHILKMLFPLIRNLL